MLKRLWVNLSFSIKLNILVAILVLFCVATGVAYQVLINQTRDMAVQQASEIMLEDYRTKLKDLVDAMSVTLAASIEGVAEEGRHHQIFTHLIRDSRFFPDRSGYFFIYKRGGTVFVLPTLPDLEGQNIIDKKDQKGNFFIRQLDQASQAGGGYVNYWFNKPGRGTLPKLSYARMIPGTNYWVGTGVYIDDVEKREQGILDKIHDTTKAFLFKLYLALGNSFLVIIVPLVVMVILSITRPLKQLTLVADRYSQGQLDLKVPGQDRNDEIGNLAKALSRLGVSVDKAMARLKSPRS